VRRESRTSSDAPLKTKRFIVVVQLLSSCCRSGSTLLLSDNKSQVQRGILNYLAQHPHAKDTLQGIIEWWLVDSRPTPGVADVREALDELVQRGWILVTKRSPSNTLYGLDEAHLDSIREFLND
jgi:hypothetical protein